MPILRPDREELLHFLRIHPRSQFVIPVYQRNYIWLAKKQVRKYLEDYKSVLNGEKPKHFIGIIMYLIIQRRIGFNENSIVDGQQRLVTTFLILYALKKIAITAGKQSFAEQIDDEYLTNPREEEENDKLRLKPLVSDDDVFNKIVKDDLESITRAEKKSNVYLNYMFIMKYLKDLFGRFSLDEMLYALDKFYFVAIPLDSVEDDAQKIFETINSAGAELTKSDLIRNYILMNMQSEQQDRFYREYWYPMEKMFSSPGRMENFFRMFLANRNYYLSNMDDVYDEFQKWFDKEKENNGIETTLKTILKYSKYYNDLFVKEDVEISPEIDSVIKEFKKNTIEPTAPLLMEIYNLYNSSDDSHEHLVSASDFSKIISLFNTYNVRRNICNQRTGVLTRVIPTMLKYIIEKGDGTYNNIYKHCVQYLVDDSKGKQSFMPDDEYLKSNLVGANAYSLRNYVKIIFEKIESHNNPAVIDFSNLSIEHLMPQKPTQEWLDTLNISKEEYEYNLHRLGNLTLATANDNSRMSNNPFEFKREILENTNHLRMNAEIIREPSWGIVQIERRTIKLIDKICELYPYVSVGSEDINSYSIYYKDDLSNVRALIFTDMSVEIQEGSIINCQYNNNIRGLVSDGHLRERGENYEFLQPCSFSSLEEVASLLNIDNANCWEIWVDRNSQPLSVDIRPKLINSINNE